MKQIFTALTVISSILLLHACGGSKTKEKNNETSKTEKSTQMEEKETVVEEKKVQEVVEITLIAKGEDMTAISYEPNSLSVPAGSRVKLTFQNESKAAGMFHNFVLVTLGAGQEIATAGIQAGKDNEFIPNSDDIFANTKIIEMGGTTTIEFDAPPKGSYHYICTYPGHYPNMIGRFNVE